MRQLDLGTSTRHSHVQALSIRHDMHLEMLISRGDICNLKLCARDLAVPLVLAAPLLGTTTECSHLCSSTLHLLKVCSTSYHPSIFSFAVGILDPYTQAFKNALTVSSFPHHARSVLKILQGWGAQPTTTEPIPDIPEAEIGTRLEPKCIDMRYDSFSQSFVSEERTTPLPVPPGWAGSVQTDPYADFAFTLHRTMSSISTYKASMSNRVKAHVLTISQGVLRHSQSAPEADLRVYHR